MIKIVSQSVIGWMLLGMTTVTGWGQAGIAPDITSPVANITRVSISPAPVNIPSPGVSTVTITIDYDVPQNAVPRGLLHNVALWDDDSILNPPGWTDDELATDPMPVLRNRGVIAGRKAYQLIATVKINCNAMAQIVEDTEKENEVELYIHVTAFGGPALPAGVTLFDPGIRNPGVVLARCIVPEENPVVSLIGDINSDMLFSRADVELAQVSLVEQAPLEPYQIMAADVALPCDGSLNNEDVFLLDFALQMQQFGFPTLSACHLGGVIGGVPSSMGGPIGAAPELSVEGALDLNGNQTLDEDELKLAIKIWVNGFTVPNTAEKIDDRKMQELVQLWITGKVITNDGEATAASAVVQSLSLQGIGLAWKNDHFSLRAQGMGIQQIQLHVYDLSGKQVLREAAFGNTLHFTPMSSTGSRWANGVYFYQVIAQGANGQVMRSEVKKLAIVN